MDKNQMSDILNLKRVKITDAFWKKEVELVRDVVVPYQWDALNDRLEGVQPSYCMHNYKVAAKLNTKKAQQPEFVQPVYTTTGFCVWPDDEKHPDDRFYGFVFQDSDFSKWIEAVAGLLMQYPDEQLEKTADEAIDIVCAAQQPDGYLDTFYIINDISKRFTNLRDHHELYCLGHLIEGAVAYYEATGKDQLLKAACRYADCVAEHIGPAPSQMHGYPGHEIAEMALARLYEVTGEEKYKELGLYFINERGKRPYYYDSEEHPADFKIDNNKTEELRYHYHQAHLPVKEQTEAVGHAVRAVYLYSGMADFARLTMDEELFEACQRLWDNIVSEKMYITGGIGGTHIGEAFSFGYDLLNDTAYAETCASIGMIFFARRMLEIRPDASYANVMERELYNVVLSGMGLDGTSFFYVNPLSVVPKACHEDLRKEHVKPVRQKWFGCACCPPNLARLLSSIGSYIFTETEDTVFVHLYMGCHMEKEMPSGTLSMDICSELPWKGQVSICTSAAQSTEMTLALRVPDWSEGYTLSGAAGMDVYEENGYIYLTGDCQNRMIQIEFDMSAQVIQADSRVREVAGMAAVVRGPMVYCLEEADNGSDLHLIKMDENTEFTEEVAEIAGQSVVVLKAQGYRQVKNESRGLYSAYLKPEYEPVMLTWIPYYTWANRGEGEMQVWTKI